MTDDNVTKRRVAKMTREVMHWFTPAQDTSLCQHCGNDKHFRLHYCCGKTEEEWAPIAQASHEAASHLPEG